MALLRIVLELRLLVVDHRAGLETGGDFAEDDGLPKRLGFWLGGVFWFCDDFGLGRVSNKDGRVSKWFYGFYGTERVVLWRSVVYATLDGAALRLLDVVLVADLHVCRNSTLYSPSFKNKPPHAVSFLKAAAVPRLALDMLSLLSTGLWTREEGMMA